MMPSAHDLLTTRDCSFPNCDREADVVDAGGMHRCVAHANKRVLGVGEHTEPAAPSMSIPDAVAVLTGRPAAAPEPEEIPMALATCKIDGCDQPRMDARGVYGGLCAGHKNEKRAARVAQTTRAGAPAPAAPVAAPAPETAAGAPDAAAVRLAHVTVEIGQHREKLLELQAEALALLDDIRERVAA